MLRQLTARRYEVARFQKCRLNIDYHVEIGGHHYSLLHKWTATIILAGIAATVLTGGEA